MSVAQQEGDVQVPVPELLGVLLDKSGSDLHLTAGAPPVVRVNGELITVTDYPVLTPRALQGMVYAILPQKLRERFEQELELDMSYSLPGRARFRVNVFMQRDAVGAVFRVIPFEIMSIEDLGLPSVVADLARFPRGFVVVTGPTGSGKSTTLAAMVDVVNRERAGHIMTVEDPIEFLHKHKTCIVNQREIGADTHSFSQALKHVLRQDPDVILVGEMRDLETIGTAITAAETGHLVFATLHTQDAPQTIDRIIDVFPPHQQQQVRVQLSTTLQGVVTQQLLPTADGQGRVAAIEVMIATPGIRNLVREGKVHQIYSAMQAGGRYGMQTMDMSLAQHVKAGRITQQMAFERCHDPEELDRLVGSALQARSDGYSGAALDVGMSMGSM
jgi:twitching motility protein PilT